MNCLRSASWSSRAFSCGRASTTSTGGRLGSLGPWPRLAVAAWLSGATAWTSHAPAPAENRPTATRDPRNQGLPPAVLGTINTRLDVKLQAELGVQCL